MIYRLNKNFLLALVFFVSLLVGSWLLMSTTQKLSAQQSGPNQSQCIASGGTWNSQIDGGICFCDDGYNDAQDACAQDFAEFRYVCDDAQTLIPQNVAQGFNPNTYCASYGGYSERRVWVCNDGETIVPPTFRGDVDVWCEDSGGFTPEPTPTNPSPTSPTSPGTPVEAGGCDDGEDCPDDAEPLPTEQVCDGNEFCERDIEECDPNDTSGRCLANLSIMRRIIVILNVMTIIIVPLITLVIIVGGVQYSMATGDPSKVNDAKKRITNAIIALVSYAFLWSFLQWLVPGGVF